MRASLSNLALAAFTAAQFATGDAAAAEALRFGGTGSAAGVLRQVGVEFTATTGIKLDVLPSLGSTGAIRALIDGAIDVAVSARPLKADEAAGGVQQVLTLRTPFVFASSRSNPAGLKADDLLAIYSGAKSTWPDGTLIRLILRPRSEADTVLLGELAPGMDKVLEAARGRAELPVAATDQDNAELAEHTPGSLITTTLAQLVTEKRNLHVLPFGGMEPTLENLESGAYRYAKKLYFIRRTAGAAQAKLFLDFLQSPQGMAALRAAKVVQGGE